MSILDANIEERLDYEATWALDRKMRTRPIRYSMIGDSVISFVNGIQNWLCEHWALGGMWHKVSYSSIIQNWDVDYNSKSRDDYEGGPTLNQPTARIASATFLEPADDYKKVYSDPVADGVKIKMQLMNMTINMPVVEIAAQALNASMMSTYMARVEPPRQWIVAWGTPSILLLRDVDNIPFEIGYWEGEFFRWKIPVEKVYLYNSPNIDPKFLALPYVETFEEHGWIV